MNPVNEENIDDGDLIELVRQFSIIYDKTHPQHKDSVGLANAWKTIASTIGASDAACEHRWAVLRAKLNAERKKIGTTPSGSGTTKIWVLYDSITFLNNHCKLRRTKGNIQKAVASQALSRTTVDRTSSPWNSINEILSDTIGAEAACDVENVFTNDASEQGTEDPDEIEGMNDETSNTRKLLPLVGGVTNVSVLQKQQNIPRKVSTIQPRAITDKQLKNNTPPLQRKRKQAALMSKLEHTWDSFNTYLTKAPVTVSNDENDSDVLFGKSVGLDLRSIRNKTIKYYLKAKITTAIKDAVTLDNTVNDDGYSPE